MTSKMATFRRIATIAAGTGAGICAYFYQKLREKKNTIEASWTNSETPVNACALWDSNWDFRDPKSLVRPKRNDSASEENRYNEELEKHKVKFSRHLIFIRHGQYLDIGDKDEAHNLTACGRLQAQYAGKRLHALGFEWDKIIVSTMTRAKETADIILKEVNHDPAIVKHCMLLREGAPIPPQPPIGHWRPEKSQFFRDGARIEAAFRRYFRRAYADETHDSYTLFVAHANVIRYFVCRALQLPPEAWLRINLNHASITWLQIQPNGNVSVRCLGDSGFMPPESVTNRTPRADLKNVV